MTLVKNIFYIIIMLNIVLPLHASAETLSNIPADNVITIIERGVPSYSKDTSYTKCTGITYSVSAEIIKKVVKGERTATGIRNPVYNLTAKVYLVEGAKKRFQAKPSMLLQNYFSDISSSGGTCESMSDNILGLSVTGYAASTGETETLTIRFSKSGMTDYKVFKEP